MRSTGKDLRRYANHFSFGQNGLFNEISHGYLVVTSSRAD